MIALSAANLTLKCGKSCTTRSVSLKEKCVFSFRGLILRINIEEKILKKAERDSLKNDRFLSDFTVWFESTDSAVELRKSS